MSYQKCTISLGGKEITVETGRLAKQATSSVLVSCGDDVVLSTVTSATEPADQDFFPLIVEYQEKFYSSGRIPGGFFKREGRPSHEAVLSSRVIDRFIRPCFPDGFRYDTQVITAVLSYSGNYPVEILASIGVSAALHISDIPFAGPTAAIQVSRVKNQWHFNASSKQKEQSDINLVLAGTRNGILMVEGEADFVKEKDILTALKEGHKALQPLLDVQDELRKQTGSVEKRKWEGVKKDEKLKSEIHQLYKDQILTALTVKEKTKRSVALNTLKSEIQTRMNPNGEDEEKEKMIRTLFDDIKYEIARSLIIEKKTRIDGRKMDEVRSIQCEAHLLPRVHGSSLFTRGETQILGTVTLGTGDDEQLLDTLSGEYKKKFLLHYNFPPFSVGEIGRVGGQSRREIGHGFLAEKALKKIIPDAEKFPYTIRIVSEVLESNGSSSMGTVCAGSLALMDAGVPIPCAIAGIAMGLIKEGSQVAVLSDILGDEDHLGDMDFKVAGSKDGITAVQMDIKIDSLGFDIIEKALDQALAGRLHILSCMDQVLSEHKSSLSVHAPRIEKIKIHTDKIRDVIGSGGKVINAIIKDTGVKIDISDDGTIHLASSDVKSIQTAKDIINKICEEAKVDKIYEGVVKKIVEFGAFVEILPNKTGLLHISEIDHKRVKRVEDYLEEGQTVKVKVVEIENNRIRLSLKALKDDK